MFTVPLSIFATSTLSSFVENQSIPIGAGFFFFLFFCFGTDYWLLSGQRSYKVTQSSALPEQAQLMPIAKRQQRLLSELSLCEYTVLG